MNKTDVCPVLISAVLCACSIVTDVDRTKIPDVLFTPPDAGSLDASASDPAASAIPTSAQIAPWGFDLAGMDMSVRPGDDFYTYANGTWLSTSEIPDDRTAWSSFTELSILVEKQISDLIEGLPDDAKPGSPAQKARDFFAAFVDTDTLEARGIEPLQPGLSEIAGATTHEEIATLMMRADLGLLAPIGIGVSIDQKNPDRYIVSIGQNGLNLPDRDYYLEADMEYVELRKAYATHLERMLTLIEAPDPAVAAQDILALETKIADKHLPIEDTRDVEANYNLRTRAEVDAIPGFPWTEALTAAGLDKETEFIVVELAAVEALAAQFTTIPVATWRSYLTYNYVLAHATLLTQAIDDERFDFYGRTLNGQPTPRKRTQRGISALNGALSEVVGQLYVQKHFPASYKKRMLELVENLRTTYEKHFRTLAWMSDETKKVAIEKLHTFRPKIGYPDKWKDYSKLEIKGDDAFGNAVRTREFGWADDLSRLGTPTDKDEWFISPQTINAYYNPTFNEIVFPAAILQPPFFDPAADLAVNYGGIGGVIGHEMGHGFDDQGAKADAQGVLRTWWKPDDEAAFKTLVDQLVVQYDGYEALPGLNINGELTVGENIGDLGGLTVAYDAYHLALHGEDAEEKDGLSGDQRFFLSWAQVWRELARDAALRNQIKSDPHSPSKFRVQGVVRNVDAWYTAFDVQPEDALYLAPEDRVHVW
jgi:predicted metalloendopeptidase